MVGSAGVDRDMVLMMRVVPSAMLIHSLQMGIVLSVLSIVFSLEVDVCVRKVSSGMGSVAVNLPVLNNLKYLMVVVDVGMGMVIRRVVSVWCVMWWMVGVAVHLMKYL